MRLSNLFPTLSQVLFDRQEHRRGVLSSLRHDAAFSDAYDGIAGEVRGIKAE
jgi:hypothetical protein